LVPLSAKLSLEECQTLALKNCEKKTIADLEALIAYDRIDEARSTGRPSLNAHGDYMSSGEARYWRDNKRNTHAKASLIIPLCNFGLTKEAIKSQKNLYQSSLHHLDQIEQDILYSVNEAYFELLTFQKLEWVVQESIRSLNRQVEITKDFLLQGLVHKNEALLLEVQLAQLHQDLMESKLNTKLATERLNRLMNIELDELTEIEDILPSITQEDCLEKFIRAAKLNHPQLLALNAEIQATKHGYKSEKATLYPNIYAFSNYSTSSDYALPYRQGFDVGVSVDLNIYDGGYTYAKLRRIKKELDQLEWRYLALEKDIELSIRSSFLTIQTALGKIPVAEKGVLLAEETFVLTQHLFEEGMISNVDVINDHENLLQAKVNYFRTLYMFHKSRANLIHSAGMMHKKGCL
jgi:outer membrane protein TolC